MNQPDHTATEQFSFIEPKGGFGATTKVAKLGARLRKENDDTVFIKEVGKTTIKIYPKRREFSEVHPDDEFEEDGEFAFTREGLAKRQDVKFALLGSDKIGKYECQKVEATYKDTRLKDLKFVFCFVPRLRNLIVYEQALVGPVTMTTVLSNVSLSVSEDVFRVPANYKKVQEKSYSEQSQELLNRIRQASPSPKPTP